MLKPPFMQCSIHFLAMKIVKGTILNISEVFSKELRELVQVLLNRDPDKRPSINQLLALPIMEKR